MTDRIEEVKKILDKALFSCESKGDYSVCLPHINNEDIIAQQIDDYYCHLFPQPATDEALREKIAFWFYLRRAKDEGLIMWDSWGKVEPIFQELCLKLANGILPLLQQRVEEATKRGIRAAIDDLKMHYCIIDTEAKIKEIEQALSDNKEEDNAKK